MDDPVEDTQAVLAAYRERKRRALDERSAAVPAASLPAPTSAPASAPPEERGPWAHAHAAGPVQADPAHPVHPPAAEPASAGGSLVAAPAPVAHAPGATLSPLGPTLRLSDALLKDANVSLRGSPRLRALGTVLVLVGLLVVVAARREAAMGDPAPTLQAAGWLAAAGGALLALLGVFVPRNRRLAVRLAASQQEEWRRVQHEARRLRTLGAVALGAAVVGLLLLAAAYSARASGLFVAGAVLAGLGLLALAAVQVRRSVARRLYVQTLVLSGLEAAGLGASADQRVPSVILALDRLLGALPESEVQAFLASPQAQAYLELVDEATRSQRGP